MELSDVEIRVLEEIKPKPEEYELLARAYSVLKESLLRALSRHGVNAEVTLQGSVEHDTWLSGDRDLDVFVLFPGDWSREDLEKKGLPIIIEGASEVGEVEIRYAEHPYVRVKFMSVEADVVAGLKLPRPDLAKTAVDRTPFHTEFIKRALSREQRDHVRLLKKFMKAIGVYGAEVKTRGFSGYAAELLVYAYGGFREVLKAASGWKPPVFVNTIGERLTRDLIKELKSRYPDSVIFVPDPVDHLRNVTASVSPKSLFTFILASKCYLANPSVEFFREPLEPSLEELVEATVGRCILLLRYDLRERLPPDIVWGEAWRVASTAERTLAVHDLRVLDYSAWTNEKDVVVVGLELERCALPAYKHYGGPCLQHEDERIINFIKKHFRRGYGPWIGRDGCLNSLDARAKVDVVEIVATRWQEFTVSPHLRTVKPVVSYATREVLEELLKMGAGRWLREFILKTPSWMEKCTF